MSSVVRSIPSLRQSIFVWSVPILCGLWVGQARSQDSEDEGRQEPLERSANSEAPTDSDGSANSEAALDPETPSDSASPADSEAPSDFVTTPDSALSAYVGVDPARGSARQKSSASVRLHGVLGATKAITGHQSKEYGFGAGGLLAAEWGPSAVWGLQLELGYLGLFGVNRDPPRDLAALGGATGLHLGGGLRIRPFAETQWKNPKGFWLSAAAGAEFTGGLVAPLLDAFLGYDFYVGENFALGPAAGYLLVLQTRDSPRPDNANLVLAGVHGTFDFGSKPPPETDRDGDGILDRLDACPDNPEDKDGFEDEDGCPELDNDQDGIADMVDRCPLDPEDKDDFEDEDGCPDPDNDQDKVLDEDDECPLDPEDRDDFEDEDGCPDPDNDQDGIPDIKDLCPNEPEVRNGIADNDGCPDAESVRVVGDKIELDQKIHFWTNSDRIRGMSYPVLDKLARFLLDHPEYIHVDIEGHADQRGDEDFNLDLSRRRAQSIANFLIKRGLEESRLSFEGFGSSRPLVEGKDEHSLFLNRRVEFVVTRNRKIRANAETGEVVDSDEADLPAFGRDHDMPAEGVE